MGLREGGEPTEDVLRAEAVSALAVRGGRVRDHGVLQHVLQAEASHRKVRHDGLYTVRGGLEPLGARLLVQRQASGVLAEAEETLMIGVLSHRLLEAIHVEGSVVPELPDGDIFGDPGYGQSRVPSRAVHAVEFRLLLEDSDKLQIGAELAEEPVARAEILQHEAEELPGAVHEHVPLGVHRRAKAALLGVPQHGVEEGRLSQRRGGGPEERAADVERQNRNTEPCASARNSTATSGKHDRVG
mmetsp:Transcript_25279/g.84418  ORF Transcript_25279/g.84418 Transcript_25279/m.84418 type:complete len:243 (-) Transcript_25279:303-1031(-)